MGRKKTGQIADCKQCGKPYHRAQHHIAHGTKTTCSKECSYLYRTGENNPFWGKKHTPEVKATMSALKIANPPKGTGPKKGVFKHTPEAKAKMSQALRERWRTKRADLLSYASRGMNAPHTELVNEPRYKKNFTKTQKRDWTGTKCAWCGATDDLVLDHIIPVICGGDRVKTNARTLCQTCSRWKMRYVDNPLYYALVGAKRGLDT